MTNETRLVWCDLEMTGLEVATNAIIELGLVITGPDLKPLAEYEAAVWQPDEVLARMEPFVREMHTKNGLLERVRRSDTSLRTVEKEITRLLLQHCDHGEGILAGNSIHTDRGFIGRYLPGFDRALHYRMVDVSSIKILVKGWYPHAAGRSKVDASHTVLSDIRASIAELAFYQQTFFKNAKDV
jgi:oligoribonuclease